ncbi:MAG: hypothetical protein Q8R02_06445 [Hyphomonadaceae bacterium]|nr:hypothetical protein [Hyphomonadaceae bacterium]
MRTGLCRVGLALACVAGLMGFGAPAFADIKAFNQAVRAADFRAASIEAADTWPELDKSAPEIAVVAREFAWVSMLAGQPAAAEVYSRFLVDQGADLPTPDPTPAVSRVLFEWSGLSKTSAPEARYRLLVALQQRAAALGRDLISVRASQLLFTKAWDAGDYVTAGKAADLALNVMTQIGPEYDVERFWMRRGRISASFMKTQSVESYNAVYDLAGEVYGAIATTTDMKVRERFATEYFNTVAWGDVMYTALRGDKRGIPDRGLTVARGRPPMNELLYPAPGDPALARCRISLAKSTRKPDYPSPQLSNGLNGVGVYAVTLSADGRYQKAQLLGSAPHAQFATALDKVLPTWRWELGEGSAAGCRMPTVQLMTLQFLP